MRMKNRLSLTIDPLIARKAKRVAKNQNKSLSALVEGLLSDVVISLSHYLHSLSVGRGS
jgi:predicted HicB family RNase H-like nuclease